MKKSIIVALLCAVALCGSLSTMAKDKKKGDDCSRKCKTEQVISPCRVVYLEQGTNFDKKTNATQKVHIYSDCASMKGKKAQAVKCAELERHGIKTKVCNTCEKRFDKIAKNRMKEGNCSKSKTDCNAQKGCSKQKTNGCGDCGKH